jgi:hypothetical protein
MTSSSGFGKLLKFIHIYLLSLIARGFAGKNQQLNALIRHVIPR